MRKNIKKILTVLILLALIILGLLLILKSKRPKTPTEEKALLPTYHIPKTFNGKLNITFDVDEQSLKLPDSLPIIKVDPPEPLQEKKIFEIAKAFGLEKNYYTTDDIRRGKTYLFKGGTTALTIYTKTNQIIYVSDVKLPTINKRLDNDTIIELAKDFLIDKGLFKEGELTFSFLVFLDLNSEEIRYTSKENASAYKVNFSPIKVEYKVITLNPDTSPINVWVAPDGSIMKAEINYLGALKTSEQNYRLKNLQDIKNTADTAAITSLDDGNIFPGDLLKDDLESITINSIELAYLAETQDTKIFQPIFLLSGKAVLRQSNKEVNITLYLPAIKNP